MNYYKWRTVRSHARSEKGGGGIAEGVAEQE